MALETSSLERARPSFLSRWPLRKLFLVAALVTLPIAGPIMLLGWADTRINEAIAPGTSRVPAPDGWSKRKLDTNHGTGNGGEFQSFIAIRPDRPLERPEAESQYGEFLVTQGWDPFPQFDGEAYRRGRSDGETILMPLGARADAIPALGPPVTAEEFLVRAEYADSGERARDRRGNRLILLGLGIAVAAGSLVAGLGAVARRSGSERPTYV